MGGERGRANRIGTRRPRLARLDFPPSLPSSLLHPPPPSSSSHPGTMAEATKDRKGMSPLHPASRSSHASSPALPRRGTLLVSPTALPFVYQFAAGAIAGVTELLCLYPLGSSRSTPTLPSPSSDTAIRNPPFAVLILPVVRLGLHSCPVRCGASMPPPSHSGAFPNRLHLQVKTRMQLQVGKAVPGAEHYDGMVDCFRKIIAKEG